MVDILLSIGLIANSIAFYFLRKGVDLAWEADQHNINSLEIRIERLERK